MAKGETGISPSSVRQRFFPISFLGISAKWRIKKEVVLLFGWFDTKTPLQLHWKYLNCMATQLSAGIKHMGPKMLFSQTT